MCEGFALQFQAFCQSKVQVQEDHPSNRHLQTVWNREEFLRVLYLRQLAGRRAPELQMMRILHPRQLRESKDGKAYATRQTPDEARHVFFAPCP